MAEIYGGGSRGDAARIGDVGLQRVRDWVLRFNEGVPEGLRKVPLTHSFAECPKCGYHNHPSAQSCLGCGAAMTPSFESEAARWRKERFTQ